MTEYKTERDAHEALQVRWKSLSRDEQTDPALMRKMIAEYQGEMAQFQHGAPASVVYYLRFCCLVKIGTTTSIADRLKVIPHHELLATEPGSYDLERERHQQFAHLRDVGEWFQAGPDLHAHIRTLQGVKPILVDTEAAAAHAGRPITVIYRWASEGRITRYGGRGKRGALWDIREIPSWTEGKGPKPAPPPVLGKNFHHTP